MDDAQARRNPAINPPQNRAKTEEEFEAIAQKTGNFQPSTPEEMAANLEITNSKIMQRGSNEEYPQSSITMWLQKMNSITAAENNYTIQMAEAIKDISTLPALTATTISMWNYIRHGLENKETEQKAVDDSLDELLEKTMIISAAIRKNETIKPEVSLEVISLVKKIWVVYAYYMEKFNLSIRLFRPKGYKRLLDMKARLHEKLFINPSPDEVTHMAGLKKEDKSA